MEMANSADMRALIAGLQDQMRLALSSDVRFPVTSPRPYSGILVLGMGGSGIGGAVMADMLRGTSSVPFVAHADQGLPGWVDEGCLVVASSYSGNTEETLAAVALAEERGCHMAAVTSGGTLWTKAESGSWPTVVMDGGHPPRSQFGQSFLGLANLLQHLGVLPASDWQALGRAVEAMDLTSCEARGESLAQAVEGKRICLYADTPWRSLLTRWRQQLNENSKLLANVEVLPEMNHNELVGWESADERHVAVMLRTAMDHPRTRHRMDITAEIFQEQGADVLVVEPDGDTPWAELLDAVWVGDWMSLVLAERSDVCPVDIRFIDRLKTTLASLP